MQQDQPKRKRERTEMACDRCRIRKIKCDGSQPICQTCLKRNINCVYSERYTRANVSTQYVKSLEEKLKNLTKNSDSSNEQTNVINLHHSASVTNSNTNININNTNNQLDYILNSTDSTGPITYNSSQSESYNVSFSVQQQQQKKQETKEEEPVEEELDDTLPPETADAMGAGKKSPTDKNFYGSSAVISLMTDLSTTIGNEDDTNNDNNKNNNSNITNNNINNNNNNSKSSTPVMNQLSPGKYRTYQMSRTGDAFKPISCVDKLIFPPRAIADQYIKNYFDYAYTLYPFIHIPTFMKTYEMIWTQDLNSLSGIDELFFAILNIIFAFGCSLDNKAAMERSESANNTVVNTKVKDALELYFNRSQELLGFHLMESGSLLLVQALLLTGQFLQATTRLAGCWNIIGLAIRIAQGLGLHTEQNYCPTRGKIEDEMRKRLWHGCILMDRIVSMTLGRPLMIIEPTGLSLPMGVDDEYILDDRVTGIPSYASTIDFFLATSRLYDILADILKEFYSDNNLNSGLLSGNNNELFQRIFQFEEKLVIFQTDEVPDHLVFTSITKHRDKFPFQRQCVILQIRYLHLKIMLYRPVLFPHKRHNKHNHKSSSNTELYKATRKSIFILCIETIIELLTLIEDFRPSELKYLPAVWYNVYYVYTAGSVLLAAKLYPHMIEEVGLERFDSAWNLALEILSSFKSQSDSAKLCSRVLKVMDQKIGKKSRNSSNKQSSMELVRSTTDEDSEAVAAFSSNKVGTAVNRKNYDEQQLHDASGGVSTCSANSSTDSTGSQTAFDDVIYSFLHDPSGLFSGGGDFLNNNSINDEGTWSFESIFNHK